MHGCVHCACVRMHMCVCVRMHTCTSRGLWLNFSVIPQPSSTLLRRRNFSLRPEAPPVRLGWLPRKLWDPSRSIISVPPHARVRRRCFLEPCPYFYVGSRDLTYVLMLTRVSNLLTELAPQFFVLI